MPRISEISIQGVRCFNSVQRARLNRITLLVGENGLGKSTFLGCHNAFAHLANLVDPTEANPFDLPPFLMGDYDTVVRSGGSGFTIGGKFHDHIHSTAEFCFGRNEKGQLFEKGVAFTFEDGNLPSKRIKMSIGSREGKEKQLSFHGPNFDFSIDWAEISYVPITTWLSRNVSQGYLPYDADRTTFEKRRGVPATSKEIGEFGKFVNFFRSEMPLPSQRCFHVRALDPDRLPRQRIYREPPKYLIDASERTQVGKVGVRLGLWQNIDLDDSVSCDGVQVSVKTSAGSHNLLDVGYGVHSMLPLVHAIAVSDTRSTFLLQQPEVHVHPVAQAELAQYIAESSHEYIIETHSDHLVDRFRLCVMEKVLQPDDLMILYFEQSEDASESRIHNISVDHEGSVVDPPNGYREFFLTETERLLGIR